MASVFLINSKGDAILRPEVVELTEYLNKVSPKILLYIILSRDYTYGPFHKKPPQQRDILAQRRIWKGKNPPEFKNVKFYKEACREYDSLIFDIHKYKLEMLMNKFETLEKDFNTETDHAKMKKILETMDLVEERIDEMNRKINISDESVELTGDKTVSLIERFIRNRKDFIKTVNQ